MKRLIYYPPGCYGTFVNWLCNVNQQVTAEDLPFLHFGNSHKYYDTNGGLITEKQRFIYLKSQRNFGVLRTCWPFNCGGKLWNLNGDDNFFHDTISSDLNNLLPLCDKIVFLHPTQQSRIWWYQNFCEKVVLSKSYVDKHFVDANFSWLTTFDPELRARYYMDLVQNHSAIKRYYSSAHVTSALQFSIGQLREAMAAELAHQGPNFYQCFATLVNDFPEIKFVSLEHLRDNFVDAVTEIFDYFEINSDVVQSLDFVKQEWLARQHHQFKDTIIDSIVNALTQDKFLDWSHSNINLFDEVYMQKILQFELGVTLRTENSWPTNSRDFKVLFV